MSDTPHLSFLDPRPANYVPLSPMSFLRRSSVAFAGKTAVVDGVTRLTYRDLESRCDALARGLIAAGLQPGDTVAAMMHNCHVMLELHYGVPLAGGIINAINTRLDTRSVAYILRHSRARLVLADAAAIDVVSKAVATLPHPIRILSVGVSNKTNNIADDYEAFIASAPEQIALPALFDEWTAISIGYTSGTTGRPKGVLCHHRGAYLNSMGNVVAARLDDRSHYLWTLPMFHCNGWSHTWAVTAVGGKHVCLPRIDPPRIFDLIHAEEITHMCAAPVVMKIILEWAQGRTVCLPHPVRILTGGAPPASRTIVEMESLGFEVIQIFGQTETTGPSLIWEEPQDYHMLDIHSRARSKTRQGYRHVAIEDIIVADPGSQRELPWDGSTMGELLVRGNTVMMGYLDDPQETDKVLRGRWFHTGDLAVRHPDGSVELKDRAKDIIISGGENISCIEIEEVLQSHPLVQNAAVVARSDEKWGEHPCAFIEVKMGWDRIPEAELTDFCRARLAAFKIPKSYNFGPLPRTETGKIQKFLLREKLRHDDNALRDEDE